jgi:hypothetical protein
MRVFYSKNPTPTAAPATAAALPRPTESQVAQSGQPDASALFSPVISAGVVVGSTAAASSEFFTGSAVTVGATCSSVVPAWLVTEVDASGSFSVFATGSVAGANSYSTSPAFS